MNNILNKVESILFKGILNPATIKPTIYNGKEIRFKNKLLSRQNKLMIKTLRKFFKAHKLHIHKCSRKHIHKL
jgi:hypothetical protein